MGRNRTVYQNDDLYYSHLSRLRNPRNWYMGHPILTDQITRQGLQTVSRGLDTILRQAIPGAVVEFGCYAGTTSLFIRRLLDSHNQSGTRPFHVYDSFQGLPNKNQYDANAAGQDFTAGKLRVSKTDLIRNFRAAGLQLPVIHKGWFQDLADHAVPQPIAFAFLDGDFYQSIFVSLQLVWPRLSPGGLVLVDDYQRPELPGVARAIRDFFGPHSAPPMQVTHNIAIIPKTYSSAVQ